MSRTRLSNAQEAVGLLGNLQAGKPGLPGQEAADEGKPGLPEPEPESEYDPEADEDEAEQDPDQPEPVAFTEKDRKDLARLEKLMDAGTRQAAEALRTIRRRQLWRLERDEQGGQRYANFEAYCQERWGHSRQWATHLTNWLRIVEEGERLGIPVPLTIKAAQGLLTGRLQEAGGLRAVLEEAKEVGVPLDRDHLKEIVIRRADYNQWSKEGTAGMTKPAAKSYAEYKSDLATVKEIGEGQQSWDVVKRAKTLDGDFAENLVALCRQERVLPRVDSLLAVLTGEALRTVAGRLKAVTEEQAEIEEKKKLLRTRRKQLKEMLQEQGLRTIRQEAKALEQELKARGVLKGKGGKQPQAQAAHGQVAAVPASPAEVGEEDEASDASEVFTNLTAAVELLDAALSGDWPTDDAELRDIGKKVRECGEKVADLSARIGELLPDAEALEPASRGQG